MHNFHKRWIGCLVLGILVASAVWVPAAGAWDEPEGEWLFSENYLGCDPSLAECVEWVVQGFVLKACCIAPDADLSDENACDNPQSARGPGNGGGGIDL
ncbi:MAG: hypothetical protein AAF481_00835 [Acidobacteriota bacterium]